MFCGYQHGILAIGMRPVDVGFHQAGHLLRILAELGASDPAKVSASMTAIDVYLVMDHEAQAFTHHSLAKSEPDKSADHYAAATTHISQRNAVIAKYGISVPAE